MIRHIELIRKGTGMSLVRGIRVACRMPSNMINMFCKRSYSNILVALFIIMVYVRLFSYAPTVHNNANRTGFSRLTIEKGNSIEIEPMKMTSDESHRHPHHADWRNNTLYFHRIHYNLKSAGAKKQGKNLMSALGKQSLVAQQGPVSQQQLRAFGKVVIAYDKSLSLTNTTVTLTDQVNIAPADYVCVHTPSPTPPSDDDTSAVTDADDDQSPPAPSPTLALATTMFFSGKHDDFMLLNTINNWANLRPFLQPVLYVTPTGHENQPNAHEAVKHACSVGWDVYVVPESNPNNFPVLRTMMADLINKYSTILVGYANGDILFDKTLQETLEFFHQHKDNITKNMPQHLITGRRKDIQLQVGHVASTLDEVYELAQKAVYHPRNGFDYFISERDAFPWHYIPPFVIGRQAFDNWLVGWSVMWQAGQEGICLSTTYAINAVHQAVEGEASGWKTRKLDNAYNNHFIDALNQHEAFLYGMTSCISYRLSRAQLANGRTRFVLKNYNALKSDHGPCRSGKITIILEANLVEKYIS